MSYVKRRKSPFLAELKNLPKLRSRARDQIRRKFYGALLLFGATYAIVLAVNLLAGKGGL